MCVCICIYIYIYNIYTHTHIYIYIYIIYIHTHTWWQRPIDVFHLSVCTHDNYLPNALFQLSLTHLAYYLIGYFSEASSASKLQKWTWCPPLPNLTVWRVYWVCCLCGFDVSLWCQCRSQWCVNSLIYVVLSSVMTGLVMTVPWFHHQPTSYNFRPSLENSMTYFAQSWSFSNVCCYYWKHFYRAVCIL